jgi:cytochrome c biogenesis protein CcmG/thiol:disulfide interchange protein DsbE
LSDPARLRSPARLLAIVIALAAVAGIVAFIATQPLASTSPSASTFVISGSPLLNKPAPPIDLVTPDGAHVRLADYAGRPVVVNFWASWCIPCRDEFPAFVGALEQHRSQGLVVLGVVHQDSADSATAFARHHAASWPILMDTANAAWKAYLGGVGIPMTFFVDRAGVIRAKS